MNPSTSVSETIITSCRSSVAFLAHGKNNVHPKGDNLFTTHRKKLVKRP